MNLFPEVLAVAVTVGIKFQVTPGSIAMLVALGLCVAIVWRWARRRT